MRVMETQSTPNGQANKPNNSTEQNNSHESWLKKCRRKGSSTVRWIKNELYAPISLFAFSLNLLGIFVLIQMLSPSKSPAEREAEDREGLANERPSLPIWKRLYAYNKGKELIDPMWFGTPFFVTTAVVYYGVKAIDKHNASFGDVDVYKTSCPENSRRTQTGVLVKLFAATVTTIGIHGHLGSLTGSESWRRELARGLEVIICPLTTLFHFSTSLHYELASAYRRIWQDNQSIRCRIARLCHCRLATHSRGSGPYIGVINPRHLEMIPLRRGLKWSGRITLLMILLSQYVQAAVLMTRRSMTHTRASVDMAMMFMVMSGFVALVQSLTLSLVNSKWVLREPFEPCTEKPCRLPECAEFKRSHNLPNVEFDFKIFGVQLAGIPRIVLHMLGGGHLQLALHLPLHYSPITLLWSIVSLKMVWNFSIRFLSTFEGGVIFWYRPIKPLPSEDTSTSPAESPMPDDEVAANASETAAPESQAAKSFTANILWGLFHVAMFMVGLLFICGGLFCLAVHAFYILVPFVGIYWRTIGETSLWKDFNTEKPCPHLWKDDFEDLLWWF